ncbi:MAG: glycosyltransferase [Cyanobacteria bacterium P01_H01_bin.121]
MRQVYFLLPGTSGKYACGGLWAELRTLKLAQGICDAAVVTYQQQEADHPFLSDLLKTADREQCILVVSWGFHVPQLLRRLKGWHCVYHAHSAGYGFKVPSNVPILTVSRNTLGYWGQYAPNNLLYYVPNQIEAEFCNLHLKRDIDVLVQTRKSSEYLVKQLVPALQSTCNVEVLDHYVEDLAGLYNRTKVYLYDSAEYWAQEGVTEGFGLQPLEAIACGCYVFSSLNGGLSDYLDPGFNCYKIANHAKAYDLERIQRVARLETSQRLPNEFLDEYRATKIQPRLQTILQEVNDFFDKGANYQADIPKLTPARRAQLFSKKVVSKLTKRLG